MKVIEEIHISPLGWLKTAIYAGLIALVYYSALYRLITNDWFQEDYSHCVMIPLVVLYLVWERRHILLTLPSEASWHGVFFVGFGILLFWLGELGGEYFTLYTSMWVVLVGLLWMHIGWAKVKAIAFPLVTMFAMFPFPNIINLPLTLSLRVLSSKIGVWMLHLYGMSAYREGNIIDLGFTQLQVVDACSGLRYLFPLMILALLLAYWFKDHMWKRATLFLSSIPISIMVNSFRIAATGVLYSLWGAEVAEGFFHGFSGWLIFMLTIPVLLVEMWILKKLPPRAKAGAQRAEGRGQRVEGKGEIEKVEPVPQIKRKFFQPAFVISIILLLATFATYKAVDFRENIPVKKSLSGLPLSIGEWTGTRELMEQEFVQVLHFSDYAIVNYVNPQGRAINFYIAYYESQRKSEAIHSPEACLPGGGWVFREAGATPIELSKGRDMRVNRAFMEKAGQRELTYYWFAKMGRSLTSLYQLKIYTFWDALTKRRTDGALVRLITPVYENEELKDAEARLQGFMKQMVPVLKEYIPE